MLEGEMYNTDSDEENMEKGLLRRIKSAAIWTRTESELQYTDQPTFEDIKIFSYNSESTTSGSSSIPQGSQSDSDSNVIREGWQCCRF
jgi:hypothetical protein